MAVVTEALLKDVEDFLARRPYAGVGILTLDEIEESDHSPGRVFYVIPNETIQPIRMEKADMEWHRELFNVGQRHGVKLRLASWLFEQQNKSA